MKAITDYNIIIVGGGPAGVSAGIYAKYDDNRPIILESKTLCWIPRLHINLLGKVEGLPGMLNTINGDTLVKRYKRSLAFMDVPYQERVSVTSIERINPGLFKIYTNDDKVYTSPVVILATGTLPKILNCQNFNLYKRNFYYFAYNKFAKYVGQQVIVVGSRNSGSTAAIYLARHGVKPIIIEKKETVQAKFKHTRYFKPLGIKLYTNTELLSVDGNHQKMGSAVIKVDQKQLKLAAKAVFVYIGIDPLNQLALSLGADIDADGYIKTDFFQTTKVPGLYVAGDICGDLKHVVAAAGQGSKAAYNANKYLKLINNK
jgi:thioredoxin reductase (NADPH)